MKTYTQPYTIPHVTIQRTGNQLTITHEELKNQQAKLFMTPTPNFTNNTQMIAESVSGTFEVLLPVADGPYYFRIVAEILVTNTFSERVLQLNQAINVRDMGGYSTNDGRFTKWGLLFRGDQLSKLDDADVTLLEKMNLKTVIDYRSDHERKLNPNRKIKNVTLTIQCDPHSSFSEAAANAVDLNEENMKLVRQLEEGQVDEKYINGHGKNVINDYREMVTSPSAQRAYSKFLKICSDVNNPPLVHHCRGGKDRTGIGSLFLLMLLGVKDSEIVNDYVLTDVIRKERNQLKFEHYKKLTDNEDYLAYLMAMIETRQEFIQGSIDRIRELYPKTESYFIDHFGLTSTEIKNMRDFYLEEGASR